MPDALAAATALSFAFSMKLVPVSSGSGSPSSATEIVSMPNGASSSPISRTLPLLWLAITSRVPGFQRQRPSHAIVSFCSATSSAMPWRASSIN